MALTAVELREQVLVRVNAPRQSTWADQNDISVSRGLHTKFDAQLPELEQQYRDILRGTVAKYQEYIDTLEELVENTDLSQITFKSRIRRMLSKLSRLGDKHAAVKFEIEGRAFGHFDRSLVMRGTDYYIDLDNGSNTSPHDGLRYPSTSIYTADGGTGETTLIETSELSRTTDDDWNGAYLYNATRGIGVLITDSSYAGGTWTLTHPTITGQVSGDEYYIIDAWLTLEQYMATTSRSEGDRGFVRAGTSEVAGTANLDIDEQGGSGGYISVIGCDSTINDPWNDGSNTLPSYSFDDNDWRFVVDKPNWWFERIRIIDSVDTVPIGMNTYNLYFVGCEFDNFNGVALYINNSGNGYIINCTVTSPGGNACIGGLEGWGYIKGCTLNGNTSGGTAYGVTAYRGCYFHVLDCKIGLIEDFGTAALRCDDLGFLFERNNEYGASGRETHVYCAAQYCEDDNAIFEAQRIEQPTGIITRTTSVTRSGGADSSMDFDPRSTCEKTRPLTAQMEGFLPKAYADIYEPTFSYWATAGIEITMSIYIRAKSAWSTYPTADELWASFSYLSSGSTADRTVISSTAVLSDGSIWVAFSATFTPQRTGWVYGDIWLGAYEASNGIYVDIKPVVS